MNRKSWIKAGLLAAIATMGAAAYADPVVYTLRTVADGKLGNLTFYEALVTFRMISDTRHVQQQNEPNGQFLYTNPSGFATVTVENGFNSTVATFAPGEVFVRYDTASGIASFGSPISPTYPIALGCTNYADASYTQDCLKGDWGTQGPNFEQGQYNGIADAQADVAAFPGDSVYSSIATLNLPTNLSQTTLLTGRAHSCATAYTVLSFNELGSCPAAAPRGLMTDKGDFYLQDQYGIFFTDSTNTGALQVEVFQREDE